MTHDYKDMKKPPINPIDMRSSAGVAARKYLKDSADYYALATSGAGAYMTVIVVKTEKVIDALKNREQRDSAFFIRGNTLHWKRRKIDVCARALGGLSNDEKIQIRARYENLAKNAQGDRSTAFETLVCDTLNKIGYKGKTWQVVSDRRNDDGSYNTDILSTDGEIMIECKGDQGRFTK